MQAATVHDIKKALEELDKTALKVLCMRLAKYKKENKELLTYLLFEAHDEQAYVAQIKNEITSAFEDLTTGNVYHLKKGLRRILRIVNKQIKYSGLPATELEARITFCQMMKEHKIPVHKNTLLMNIYQQQLKKITQVLQKLDEDLQFDYEADVASLSKI